MNLRRLRELGHGARQVDVPPAPPSVLLKFPKVLIVSELAPIFWLGIFGPCFGNPTVTVTGA